MNHQVVPSPALLARDAAQLGDPPCWRVPVEFIAACSQSRVLKGLLARRTQEGYALPTARVFLQRDTTPGGRWRFYAAIDFNAPPGLVIPLDIFPVENNPFEMGK